MHKYLVIMKSCNEKTGDWVIGLLNSRLAAANYFAKKKMISLKDWLKIYTISK